MPWGAQTWLRATKESVFGTFDASATVIMWIRLTDGAAFAMDPAPQTVDIRGADGGNLPAQRFSQRLLIAGSLKTPLYPSQAINLVPWACTPVSQQLTSFTLDYFDNVEARRYLGCKVRQLKLDCSSTADTLTANFDLVAWKPDPVAPTLAQPAPSVFPTERPFTHQDSKGLVTINSIVTGYRSLSLTVANIIDAPFDEDTYVSFVDYCGRDCTLELARQYTSNADRIAFEAISAATISVGWSVATPAHSLTINMQALNYPMTRRVERDFSKRTYQTLSYKAYKDPTSGVDLAVTTT